jgi:hypothetical protein
MAGTILAALSGSPDHDKAAGVDAAIDLYADRAAGAALVSPGR